MRVMEIKYPGIRHNLTEYMRRREGETVYLIEILKHLMPVYGFEPIYQKTWRFNNDHSFRKCIFIILDQLGWKRIGSHRQVQDPGFRKVG